MLYYNKSILFCCVTFLTTLPGCTTTTPFKNEIDLTALPSVTKDATAPTSQSLKPENNSPSTNPTSHSSNQNNIYSGRPQYTQRETLPIDLPTVIRLIDSQSPAIGYANAKVREAAAKMQSAEVLWLPNLSVGTAYTRFDGQTQNQRGEIFSVSRANLFSGGGPTLSLDIAEAIYRPLIERRLTRVEMLREQATAANAELEGVNAYWDLVFVYSLLEINADTLEKAEAMLKAARNAQEAKLDRTPGDVNRAETEVVFRKTERIDLQSKASAASARLGRLLLLSPSVKLVPADNVVAPITLIDPNKTLDDLIDLALAQRNDLAAGRENIAAAWNKVRRQERGPLFPKVSLVNQTGAFGGGLNDKLTDFDARNALSLQLYWEVKNLGFGNQAENSERQAALSQAQFQLVETQARATAEIVETAHIAAAKYDSLDLAEQGVKSALELYRINKEGIFNVVDAKNLFDALRPLQAIQVLNQARQSYLTAVIEFNRAQYRLFHQIGYMPNLAANSSK